MYCCYYYLVGKSTQHELRLLLSARGSTGLLLVPFRYARQVQAL